MLLLIAVGIYSLIAKRIRVTRSFTITGERASKYGAALLIGAIPYTLGVRAVVPELIPNRILADALFGPLINASVLAVALVGLAFTFRDPSEPAVADKQANLVAPPDTPAN